MHNQEGKSLDGRLIVRTVPRMVQAGEIPGPNGTRIPVFEQDVDPNTKKPIFDTFLSVEGIGIGIDMVNGRVSADGQRFYGIELAGIEHLDIRLSDGASSAHPTEDGNDSFTIVGTPQGTKLTLWGGGGNDTFLVHGIGDDATILGGLGDDTVNVKTVADGIDNDDDGFIDELDELDALSLVLGRLTVDGNNHIVEQVNPVLASESFLQPFLTTPLVVIPDSSQASRNFNNQTYFIPKFVPILDNTGSQLRVYTVVITAAGTVAEQLVQERGTQQFGLHKRDSSNQPLFFDVDGTETTDASKTGLPVILYVPAGTAGSKVVLVDDQFNEFLDPGANLFANGGFSSSAASWTIANVDSNGGHRSTGGNTGGRFILNSDGAAGTDPSISQTISGLQIGFVYRISVDVRAIGGSGDVANTFGILVDGAFKGGTSRAAATGWTTVAIEFEATAASHTITFAGERNSVDQSYEIDNAFASIRVAKVVTDWANGNALVSVDLGGRRVTVDTGQPSIVPVNQVALGNFTRVFDKIVAGGGTDVLNIRSTGSGVGDLSVLMDTYRVPVSELAGGVPVLHATGSALPTYHLAPVRKFHFGGEPVLDPFSGKPLTYSGGEDVLDLFTGQPVRDPFGQITKRQAGDPMLHIAGDPVYHVRGEVQRWLGGEAVTDELGNPVFNNATTPFQRASGQAIVENRRQVVYDLVDKDGVVKPVGALDYEPRALSATAGTAVALGYDLKAGDNVYVTVFRGTRIENLRSDQFAVTTGLANDTLTINAGLFAGPVTVKVVIATPAQHKAGDAKYYFGDEAIQAGRPVTDSQGNLTFDDQGDVRLYSAVDLTQSRRELLNFGSGTIKLQTAPLSGLKVFVGGTQLTSGQFASNGNTLTITGVSPAAGTRVIVEYSGARLHRRGEPVYKQDATGFWIADTYAGGEAKLTLGNEAKLHIGGERADYFAEDRKLVVQHEQRLLATGTGGMPGSIHWVGIDDVNLFFGAGDDKITIDTTHAGTTDLETGGGNDQVAVRTISGATSILTQGGTDAVSVGSNAGFWSEYDLNGVITVTRFISVNGTLDKIAAPLTVDGGAGIDALRLDDTGDGNDNTGTLTLNTIRGLDMPSGVDYTAFESLNIDLGAGGDTFTIESTHATASGVERFTTVEGRGGADKIYVRTTSGPTTIRGDGSETIGTHVVSTGTGGDRIKVGTNQPATLGTVNQIVGLLTIEGGGGDDLLVVDDTGDGAKNIGSLTATTLAGLGMTLTPFGTRPNLIQVVTINGAEEGRFRLKIGSQLTQELDWDATQDEVRAELEALLGAGNVTVAQVADTYVVTYIGALGGQAGWNVAALEAVDGAEFGLIAASGTPIVLTVERMTNGRIDYTGFEDLLRRARVRTRCAQHPEHALRPHDRQRGRRQ